MRSLSCHVIVLLTASVHFCTQATELPTCKRTRFLDQAEKELLLACEKFFNASRSTMVTAEISFGELIDKITILQIKQERITDTKKRRNVNTELELLLATFHTTCPQSPHLDELIKKLREVNEKLWDIEDDIRDKERDRAFDESFIQLARSVYYTNDERCRIKRLINDLLGSQIQEEKSYTDYTQASTTN